MIMFIVSTDKVHLGQTAKDILFIKNQSSRKKIVIDEICVSSSRDVLVTIKVDEDHMSGGDMIVPMDLNRNNDSKSVLNPENCLYGSLLLTDDGLTYGSYHAQENKVFKEHPEIVLGRANSLSIRVLGHSDGVAFASVKYREVAGDRDWETISGCSLKTLFSWA